MKLSIVYPMIFRRYTKNIIRGYNHNRRWDQRHANRVPGSVVDSGPEPLIIIESVPVATVEIETFRVWH